MNVTIGRVQSELMGWSHSIAHGRISIRLGVDGSFWVGPADERCSVLATPDGQTLMWTNGKRVKTIVKVGDYIEVGGGAAGDETAARWDTSEMPAGGLWVATTDISE